MNILQVLIGIMSVGFDTFIFYNFFETIFEKSKYSKKIIYGFYLITFLITAILKFFFFHNANLSLFVYGTIILLSFLYAKNTPIRIIASTILMILVLLSETIAGMILVLITQKSVDYLQKDTLFYLCGVLVAKILELIIVKILKYKKLTSDYHLSKLLVIPLMSLPFATMLIIYTIIDFAASITASRPSFFVGISIFFLIIANLLVFYLFENHLKSEAEKSYNQLIEQQLKNQAQYFKDLAEKHKISNKAIHDTKNQLFAISILLSNNQTEAARKKIDELCNNVFNTINISNTGNDTIDALINNKYQIIQSAEIKFQSDFKITTQNQIDDIDLCIVIGNAIDNAIEAVQNIKSGEKEICVKAIQVNDYLSIDISNTIENPVKLQDGIPETTKKDKHLHGFGLQNIEEIVNKYDGHMSISQSHDRFNLKIYMKNILSVPDMQK